MQQALGALELAENNSYSEWCTKRYVNAADALRAELAASQGEPTPLTIERLRDALVASRIIPPVAVEDPDEYDDGVTLYRIEALHRRLAAPPAAPQGGPVQCRMCAAFFARFRCNKPMECDCPKCQGYCDCLPAAPSGEGETS